MSDKDYRVFYDNYMKTNAATEATGLIYCAADSGEEWNAYRDIFDFDNFANMNSMRNHLHPRHKHTLSSFSEFAVKHFQGYWDHPIA